MERVWPGPIYRACVPSASDSAPQHAHPPLPPHFPWLINAPRLIAGAGIPLNHRQARINRNNRRVSPPGVTPVMCCDERGQAEAVTRSSPPLSSAHGRAGWWPRWRVLLLGSSVARPRTARPRRFPRRGPRVIARDRAIARPPRRVPDHRGPSPRCGRGSGSRSCLLPFQGGPLPAQLVPAGALATGVTASPRLRWSGGGQSWQVPLAGPVCHEPQIPAPANRGLCAPGPRLRGQCAPGPIKLRDRGFCCLPRRLAILGAAGGPDGVAVVQLDPLAAA
jgi:hypothetical protein